MNKAEPHSELKGVLHYGAIEALRGIDMTIGCGKVVPLLGDNGAGN